MPWLATTNEDICTNEIKGIPYCNDCYDKVQRLRNWNDGTFMIALIFGAIGGVIGLIGRGVDESWVELLRFQTWLLAGAARAIIGGIVYGLIWILLLPLRVIFHSRVAIPSIKVLKSKDPSVTRLKFSNEKYAELFREDNKLVSG